MPSSHTQPHRCGSLWFAVCAAALLSLAGVALCRRWTPRTAATSTSTPCTSCSRRTNGPSETKVRGPAHHHTHQQPTMATTTRAATSQQVQRTARTGRRKQKKRGQGVPARCKAAPPLTRSLLIVVATARRWLWLSEWDDFIRSDDAERSSNINTPPWSISHCVCCLVFACLCCLVDWLKIRRRITSITKITSACCPAEQRAPYASWNWRLRRRSSLGVNTRTTPVFLPHTYRPLRFFFALSLLRARLQLMAFADFIPELEPALVAARARLRPKPRR